MGSMMELEPVLAKLLITLNENDDQEMKFLGKFLGSRELNALVNLHQKVQITSEFIMLA